MSFASLRKVIRSARKGLCSTCSKTRYPQLEAAGAGHVRCLIYSLDSLGMLIRDEHDVTAMHVAARKGHISILSYLVENKLVDGIPRAKNGATPAHDAAGTGNIRCLSYILTQTIASPNDLDVNNATPLHWAVQAGHLKVIQWLVIKANAAVDTSTKNGMTLLHLASSKNYLDIVRWLTLFLYKNHSKPRQLVNSKDRNGATPIYHAACAGHVNVIQWLAEKGGGDPTIFTSQGFAPIHAAANGGYLDAVKYLFQFGSATAPGGLRTTEGVSSMHFAAAEGHLKIIEWFVQGKKCTGNERDYYQSTPLHDAAENGHIKIIQLLIEYGADCHLVNVEGHTPLHLAVKNGQSKAAHYLSVLMKQGELGGKNGSSTTKLPVSGFDGDVDHYEPGNEDDDMSEAEWTTLRDLMGESEIEQLHRSPLVTSSQKHQAEEKRRKLEEDIRHEKEERIRKRQELMMTEEQELSEQMLRERILQTQSQIDTEQAAAESAYEPVKKRRLSSHVGPVMSGNLPTPAQIPRRISLPGSISSLELSRRLVEKKLFTHNHKMPSSKRTGKNKSKWWSRRSSNPSTQNLKTSQSWEAFRAYMRSSVTPYEGDEENNNIPEPPPPPTIDYLLGGTSIHLHKIIHSILKDQLNERDAHLKISKEESGDATGKDSDEMHASDSNSSVGPSCGFSKEERRHHRSNHKRKAKGEENFNAVDWSTHQLPSPHTSPEPIRSDDKTLESPSPTKKMRKPIPMSSLVPQSNITCKKDPFVAQQRLNFNVLDELNQVLEQDVLSTHASYTSSLNSSSSLSSPSSLETSPLHVTHANTNTTESNRVALLAESPISPVSGIRMSKSRHKLHPHHTQLSTHASSRPHLHSHRQKRPAASQPDKMTRQGKLINSSSASSCVPQISRQHGRVDEQLCDPDKSIDNIKLHQDERKARLVNASANSMLQPGTEEEMESETDDISEYTSSSSENASTSNSDDTSDSSDEELQMKKPMTPKRLITVSSTPGRLGRVEVRGRRACGEGSRGFSRLRMLLRYPKRFYKSVINLDTIVEKAEEAVFQSDTSHDRAVIFHRIQVERQCIKAWRKYMEVMKAIYYEVGKMTQKRRRENLAKAFYAWIQVRNLGIMEMEEDRADLLYKRTLKRKTFRAWLYVKVGVNISMSRSASLQRVDAKLKYLQWLNRQLEGGGIGERVDNISRSLSDGTLIIHAVSYASGNKLPRFNPRPKVRLHRQDNWKTAHEYMKAAGINVRAIEPADLANNLEAAIYHLFKAILKWYETRHSQ